MVVLLQKRLYWPLGRLKRVIRNPWHSKISKYSIGQLAWSGNTYEFFACDTEIQHGIKRRVFANATSSNRVGGLSVQQHGDSPIVSGHGWAQKRRPLRAVRSARAVRPTDGLPTGRGQTAAEGFSRRRDRPGPAERLLLPNFLPRIHTKVRRGTSIKL